MVVKTGQDSGKPPKPPKKRFSGIAGRILRGKHTKDEDSSLSNRPDVSEQPSSSKGLLFAEERQDDDVQRREESSHSASRTSSNSSSQKRRQLLRSNKKAFKDPEVRAEVTKLYKLINQASHAEGLLSANSKVPVRSRSSKTSKFDEMLEKYGDYLVDESGGKITKNPRVIKCPLFEKRGQVTEQRTPTEVTNSSTHAESWLGWFVQSNHHGNSGPTVTDRSEDMKAGSSICGLFSSPSATANQVLKEAPGDTTTGFAQTFESVSFTQPGHLSDQNVAKDRENTNFVARILGCVGGAFYDSLTPLESAHLDSQQAQSEVSIDEKKEVVTEKQNNQVCSSTVPESREAEPESIVIVRNAEAQDEKAVSDDDPSQSKTPPPESIVAPPNQVSVSPPGRARAGSLGSLFRFRRGKRNSDSRSNSKESKTGTLKIREVPSPGEPKTEDSQSTRLDSSQTNKNSEEKSPGGLHDTDGSKPAKCRNDFDHSESCQRKRCDEGSDSSLVQKHDSNDSNKVDTPKVNEGCSAYSDRPAGQTLNVPSSMRTRELPTGVSTEDDCTTRRMTGASNQNSLSRSSSIKIAMSNSSRASYKSSESKASRKPSLDKSLLSQLESAHKSADPGLPQLVSPLMPNDILSKEEEASPINGGFGSTQVTRTIAATDTDSPSHDAEQSYLLGYLLAQLTFQGETDKKGKAEPQEKGVNLTDKKSQIHIPLPRDGTSLSDILRLLQLHQSPRLARGYLTYILAEFARHACSVDRAALQKGYVERLYQRPPALASGTESTSEAMKPNHPDPASTEAIMFPIIVNPTQDKNPADKTAFQDQAMVTKTRSVSSTLSGVSKVSQTDTVSSEKCGKGADVNDSDVKAAPTQEMELTASISSGIETSRPASYSIFGRGCSCFGGVQPVDSEELDTLTTAVENSIATLRDDERDEDRDDSSSGSSNDHSEHDDAGGSLAFSDIESWFDFLDGRETYSSSEDEDDNDTESNGESSKEVDPPPSFDVSEWMLQK